MRLRGCWFHALLFAHTSPNLKGTPNLTCPARHVSIFPLGPPARQAGLRPHVAPPALLVLCRTIAVFCIFKNRPVPTEFCFPSRLLVSTHFLLILQPICTKGQKPTSRTSQRTLLLLLRALEWRALLQQALAIYDTYAIANDFSMRFPPLSQETRRHQSLCTRAMMFALRRCRSFDQSQQPFNRH